MKVAILGGGQLARMLMLAGYSLGLQLQALDPTDDACAGQVGPLRVGDYTDEKWLGHLANWADVATFEFENVPAAAVNLLEPQVAVYPPPAALEVAQDRVAEKTLFWELGIPTPPFATVTSWEELQGAVAWIELPAVLKTRRLGYDGKGQRVLRHPHDLASAWQALGGMPLILEQFVPFAWEASVLAVRGRNGDCAFYPLVENRHRDGILRLSRAPRQAPELERIGWEYARRLLERLNYVGVLALEFFVKDEQLIANEMAPRVHNSGHWTIEGAVTSQFENHLRAILGWPLGATTAIGHSVMLNCIGALPEPAAALAMPNVHLHAYGKAPRPGRKVGHLTAWADNIAALAATVQQMAPLAGGGQPEDSAELR